jgi:hypothetical protein
MGYYRVNTQANSRSLFIFQDRNMIIAEREAFISQFINKNLW